MNPYLKGFLSLFGLQPIQKPMNDYEAIVSDWQVIGDDMREATKIVMADDIVNSLSRKIERRMKRGKVL